MAQKTIQEIGNCVGKEFNISSSKITAQIGNGKRVTKATLKLNNVSFPAVSDVYIYAGCGCEDEKLVDVVKGASYQSLSIDLTHQVDCIVKNPTKQVKLKFSADITSSQAELYLEYTPAQIMHSNNAYIDIDAKKSGSGKVNLATGALQFKTANLVYNSWQAGKQEVQIDDDTSAVKTFATNCGKGWKLNAEQHLVRNSDGDKQSVYTYIDGDGNFHEFTERYYYMNGVKKVYVKKANVVTDLNGKLTYKKHEVKIERRSTSGLVLETDYNGFKGGHLLEQRQNEQIELEEKVEAYENQLKQYVIVKKENGDTLYTLKSNDGTLSDCESFIAKVEKKNEKDVEKLMLTESEAIQYNSLLLQKTSDSQDSSGKLIASSNFTPGTDYSDTQLENKKYDGMYDKYLINMQRLVKHLRRDLATLTKKSNWAYPGKDPRYLYDEYYNYLKKAQYKAGNACQLDVVGQGRVAAGWTNGTKLICSADGNETDGNGHFHHHLLNHVCDLETEIALIVEDMEVHNRSLDECKTEREHKMELERRLKKFQDSFQNRIEKLQQHITVFEQEINDYIEVE